MALSEFFLVIVGGISNVMYTLLSCLQIDNNRLQVKKHSARSHL